MLFTTLLSAATLIQGSAAVYQIVQDYGGASFFDHFDFYTGDDPTHGYVNYVDRGTAQAQGLINTNGGVAYIGVDRSNVASGRGRNSVRLSSKNTFTRGLVVLQLGHMPNSQCGSWPAFWTLGDNWPYNGEIDIIEGVNNQNVNFMTLHTSPNCAVLNGGNGLLQPYTQDCNSFVNGNTGCAFHENNPASYGNVLNQNGGAIYAMEWTSAGISIWWWGGGNPAPGDVLSNNPNPAGWGPPSANFGGVGCVWDEHFREHRIIFDITFCGDWAGSVFGSNPACSGLGSCNDYVRTRPGDFGETYWSVQNLKLYQNFNLNKEDEQSAKAEGKFEPRAAASQVAPEKLPEASRTVDAAMAIMAAQAEASDAADRLKEGSKRAKRAAASQLAPEKLPEPSKTVDPIVAIEQAQNGSGGEKVKKSGVSMMGESRRRRYGTA